MGPGRALAAACAGLVASSVVAAGEAPWFENVAGPLGLGESPAKRVVFVDLDGDGFLDVVLDRSRVFFSEPAPRSARLPGARSFRDGTAEAGLDRPHEPSLVLFGDADGDGDPDALSVRYQEPEKAKPDPADASRPLLDASGQPVPARPDDGTRTTVFLNDGSGRFAPRKASGFEELPETTSAASFLDFDRDGRLDLFLGNWYRSYGWSVEAYPDRLLRGTGDGSFVDVTAAAGFDEIREPGHADSARPTYGVTAADWNGDGWTDLLTASYGRQWNRLWENQGDGRFVDRAAPTGFDADAERSGDYPCIERETEEPFRTGGNTFDVAALDHDNDGDLDVYLGEIAHWWAGPSSDLSSLLVNLGPEAGHRFERRLPKGLARVHEQPWRWNQGDIHVGWLDFDNDTLPDLLIASGDYPDGQYLRLFRQLPGGRFLDVTAAAGFDWEGSGSISLGDFDRDGDLDILVGRSLFRLPKERREALGPAPALFRNAIGQERHWLSLRLQGAGPPRGASAAAIGATVRLTSGGLVQTRQVMSSLGHAGHQDAPELWFGLGESARVDRLEIRWPDRAGSIDVLESLPADRHVRVRQVVGGAPELELARPARPDRGSGTRGRR